MKLKFKTKKGTDVFYEAYVDKKYFTSDRVAARIIVNGHNLLYVWGKQYDSPRGWDTNKIQLDEQMVKNTFVSLKLISGDVTSTNSTNSINNINNINNINSCTVDAYEARIKAMEQKMLLMQSNMEMLSSSVVQNAQMLHQKISLDGMRMEMEMEIGNQSPAPHEESIEPIAFNFDAIETIPEEEEEFFFDDIELEEVAMTSVTETKVEEIEESPKPRRRAASRE